ncbi:MAG TPA: argininosuccinate lyase [Firmicutes bacterium]|nr:argininosuccinate lyase [Bacillota bacterium]
MTEGVSFFERIQGKLHPVTVKYYYGPRMLKSKESLPYLARVLLAHVVMLVKRGIIPESAGAKLAESLLQFALEPDKAKLALDPGLEDLYVNLERLLTRELGAEVSGYLPVGRSRNDLEGTMWRMELREKAARVLDSFISLVRILCRRAEEMSEAIMPGYTYGQQAQPITMGHYLSGIASALLRDCGRMADAVKRFDYCPLGAAAFAGTGYPIDRELTARLLGFRGVMEHSLDAVASADFMLETLSAAAMGAVTLTRFAEDIMKWCSNEVGFASLPDDLIDSSSIMPQKRNPVIVATVRSQGRLVAGKVSALYAACSVGFEASRDVTVAWEEVLECLGIVEGMSEITSAYTGEIIFNTETMERALSIGFSNATEVADTLVREGGMPFRLAHQVVGAAVADLYSRGGTPAEFTCALLDRWCRKIAGIPLPVNEAAVREALDNRVGVARRISIGGPAPSEVRRMIAAQRVAADELEDISTSWAARWRDAGRQLEEEARGLIARTVHNDSGVM